MKMKSVHHRRPRSRGGKTNKRNCCKVNSDRHHHWHALFGNMSGEEIMNEFNSCWLDPRFKIVKR